MSDPWQVLADCPHCRIEAAVVEWMDPTHPPFRDGVPAWRRCRCCGFEERSDDAGVVTVAVAAQDLRVDGAAESALARWAEAEGEGSVARFCSGNFGAEPAEVADRIRRGEVVGSTFDVIQFLFPQMGFGGVAPDQRPRVADGVEAPPPEVPAPPPSPRQDPRTPGRFLVSVMLADGALRASERAFVDAFLSRSGLPPLAPDDLRVWRPLELGEPPPAAQRDRLLEAAVHLMHLDASRDGNEWRVLRVFASAWGAPESRLLAWDHHYSRRYSSVMQRLGMLLGSWLA